MGDPQVDFLLEHDEIGTFISQVERTADELFGATTGPLLRQQLVITDYMLRHVEYTRTFGVTRTNSVGTVACRISIFTPDELHSIQEPAQFSHALDFEDDDTEIDETILAERDGIKTVFEVDCVNRTVRILRSIAKLMLSIDGETTLEEIDDLDLESFFEIDPESEPECEIDTTYKIFASDVFSFQDAVTLLRHE